MKKGVSNLIASEYAFNHAVRRRAEQPVCSAWYGMLGLLSIVQYHPSGSLEPSEADIQITNRLKGALGLVDMKLLDHLILNEDEQYSTIE